MLSKKIFVPLLPLALMTSSLIFTSCGGGGGGQSPDPSHSDNPGDSETYADIYSANGVHLKTNRLPSQLKANSDLPICQTGETYALDKCWQSITINADSKTITVENTDGKSEQLFEFNKQINSNFKSLYQMKISSSFETNLCDKQMSMYGQCYETFANPGSFEQYFQIPYQADAGVSTPRVSFRSIAGEWTASSLPEVTPWVTSNEITLDKETSNAISFGVKTTFAYGLIENTSSYLNPYKIAHYWDLNGSLIINAKQYHFPLTFSDLEKDMTLEDVGSQTGYMDSKRIKVGDIYVIFYPEKNTKYSYLDYITGSNKNTDKIKGIVITPAWDENF